MREKFSIPGFKLDLTPPQHIFAKALKKNGFKFDMLRGSAATVKLVKERKYGYINNSNSRSPLKGLKTVHFGISFS